MNRFQILFSYLLGGPGLTLAHSTLCSPRSTAPSYFFGPSARIIQFDDKKSSKNQPRRLGFEPWTLGAIST